MFNKYLTLFLCILVTGGTSTVIQAETTNQWRTRALDLQTHIDDNVPLSMATFIGTHNSYNNTADGYIIQNHEKNVTDQLNAGARIINYDIHFAFFEPRLCHAVAAIGCGFDTLLKDGLTEIKNWLNNNPDEVVFLVLEDKFTGPDHYKVAIEDIEATLDEKIYGQGNGQCNTLNLGRVSKQDILDDGKQLVIIEDRADCGASDAGSHSSNWFQYVWKVNWEVKGAGSSSNDEHVNYINSCETHATRPNNTWVQVYEDRLDGNYVDYRALTSSELDDLVNKCNVATFGLDMFLDVDRRDSLIWSWSKSGKQPDNYGGNQDCAAQGYQGSRKWDDRSCSVTSKYTCQNATTNTWKVTLSTGIWNAVKAELACISEFGIDYSFGVPRNAGQNGRLANANVPTELVWINYSDSQQEGNWQSSDARNTALSLLID